MRTEKAGEMEWTRGYIGTPPKPKITVGFQTQHRQLRVASHLESPQDPTIQPIGPAVKTGLK